MKLRYVDERRDRVSYLDEDGRAVLVPCDDKNRDWKRIMESGGPILDPLPKPAVLEDPGVLALRVIQLDLDIEDETDNVKKAALRDRRKVVKAAYKLARAARTA